MIRKGLVSTGLIMPVIKEGDNISDLLVNYLVENCEELNLRDRDVLCITESIVARAEGNYVTLDDIAQDIERLYGKEPELVLVYPIFSRNRFSMILRGIARACKSIRLVLGPIDEVGNLVVNQYTGIDIEKYYQGIIEGENCSCTFAITLEAAVWDCPNILISQCHPDQSLESYIQAMMNPEIEAKIYGLKDLCSRPVSNEAGFNRDWGLLGSNKATEDKLKLFPKRETCQTLVDEIKRRVEEKTGVKLECLVYGDGAYKDPSSGIWEFADPVVAPGYTRASRNTGRSQIQVLSR